MNKPTKFLLFSVALLLLALAIFTPRGTGPFGADEEPLSDLMSGSLEVDSVEWQEDVMWVLGSDRRRYLVRAVEVKTPLRADLAKSLVARGATVRILSQPASKTIGTLLPLLIFPLLIFGLLYFFVLRSQMRYQGKPPQDIG